MELEVLRAEETRGYGAGGAEDRGDERLCSWRC